MTFQVILIGEPEPECVECLTPTVECSIPPRDGTEEILSADEKSTVLKSEYVRFTWCFVIFMEELISATVMLCSGKGIVWEFAST